MRHTFILALVVLGATVSACAGERSGREAASPKEQVATFAGGCFWCMEGPFEKLEGVLDVVSGYTGGTEKNPTYEAVSTGRTGHAEAVRVRYDPTRVSYRQLLEVYWRQIDPTDAGGQFADRGKHYRTAIFHHDEVQRRLAETSKAELAGSERFERPIVTEILPAGPFYPAEAYHQDYSVKNPERYSAYHFGSGRAAFCERAWRTQSEPAKAEYARPSDEVLKKRLDPMQFRVTRQDGTEPPFENAYWNEKRPGIYVDVVSGEPLFASIDKFDSGTGWPSFTRPLEPDGIARRDDEALEYTRTEVRSRRADSHLGHVFPDGPEPTGLRYCINSAALRFVPAGDLEKEGFGQYLHLFRQPARPAR